MHGQSLHTYISTHPGYVLLWKHQGQVYADQKKRDSAETCVDHKVSHFTLCALAENYLVDQQSPLETVK